MMRLLFVFALILLPLSLLAEKLELTLKEYLKRVRENALAIKVEEHTPQIAAAEYHEKRDIHASELNADYSIIDLNPIGFGASGINQQLDIGVSKKFVETGTTLSSIFKNANRQVLSPLPGSGTSFGSIETRQSELEFSLKQSILRNGPIYLSGKIGLDLARSNVQLEKSTFNQSLQGLIKSALQSYWLYQLNAKQYAFALANLKDAREIEKRNRRKVDFGTIDRSTLYESQASVIEKKVDVAKISDELKRIKENILFLMGMANREENEIDLIFLDLLEFRMQTFNKQAIYLDALKHSKVIARSQIFVDIAEMALKQARSTMLPILDLDMRYTLRGTSEDNFGEAIGDLFNDVGGSAEFFIGLRFEVPLNPKAIRTIKEKAEITLFQSKDRLAKAEQDVKLAVSDQLRNLAYLAELVKDNQFAVNVMKKSRNEYRKDFDKGKIDFKTFVDSDGRLIQWRRRYLQSLFDYEMAKVDLQITQGIFLSFNGVEELDTKAKIK